MNNNKYLITVVVPSVETTYNIYIPNNKKVGTIKDIIIKNFPELTMNVFTKEKCIFVDAQTGKPFDNDKYVQESGIVNGTRIIVL